MRNHYLGVLFLSAIVVLVIIKGFTTAGNPFEQRLMRYDETRLQDFSNLKYAVENYYRSNKVLPDEISDLKNYERAKDPETKNFYEYKVVSGSKYQFCTTFSTDSKEVEEKRNSQEGYSYYEDNLSEERQHIKGYDCIDYDIPNYMINQIQGKTKPSN